MLCFYHRHCVSGMGMGRGSPEPPASSEMDDNSLSPEACYECKINGYPKRGRKRRSANETDASNIEVGQSGFSRCLLLHKGFPDSCGFLQGCSKVSTVSLGRKSRHSLSSGLYFIRVYGAFWSFLMLLGSGHSKVFTYLLISCVSPKRK